MSNRPMGREIFGESHLVPEGAGNSRSQVFGESSHDPQGKVLSTGEIVGEKARGPQVEVPLISSFSDVRPYASQEVAISIAETSF